MRTPPGPLALSFSKSKYDGQDLSSLGLREPTTVSGWEAHRWGRGGGDGQRALILPDVPSTCCRLQWSFQLRAQLLVPSNGDWAFSIPPLYADNGTRLFVDGALVLSGASQPDRDNMRQFVRAAGCASLHCPPALPFTLGLLPVKLGDDASIPSKTLTLTQGLHDIQVRLQGACVRACPTRNCLAQIFVTLLLALAGGRI